MDDLTHLREFVAQLPCENKFQAVLRVALNNKVTTPESAPPAPKLACRKCFTPWSAGFFSVEVLPAKSQCWKHIDKWNKLANLTNRQKSLLDYFKSRSVRVAKFTCQICSHKTRLTLEKEAKRPQLKLKKSGVKASTKQLPNLPKLNKENPSKPKKPDSTSKPNKLSKEKPPKREKTNTAGLKIPTKKVVDTSQNGQKTASQSKLGSRPHTPKDFRTAQQLLSGAVSSKKPVKQATSKKPSKQINGGRRIK